MSDQIKSDGEIEMFVAGLVLDPATNAPIVILKDSSGDICLPIWIGLAEATAIASAIKKVDVQRPMTHDLLSDTIAQLGAKVVRVVINDLKENTFFARIEVRTHEKLISIDARPSDAIALAVRVNASVAVSAVVLERAQLTLVEVGGDVAEELGAEADATAESGGAANFAEIDKEKWSELLEDMDPDDFKYKM